MTRTYRGDVAIWVQLPVSADSDFLGCGSLSISIWISSALHTSFHNHRETKRLCSLVVRTTCRMFETMVQVFASGWLVNTTAQTEHFVISQATVQPMRQMTIPKRFWFHADTEEEHFFKSQKHSQDTKTLPCSL